MNLNFFLQNFILLSFWQQTQTFSVTDLFLLLSKGFKIFSQHLPLVLLWKAGCRFQQNFSRATMSAVLRSADMQAVSECCRSSNIIFFPGSHWPGVVRFYVHILCIWRIKSCIRQRLSRPKNYPGMHVCCFGAAWTRHALSFISKCFYFPFIHFSWILTRLL